MSAMKAFIERVRWSLAMQGLNEVIVRDKAAQILSAGTAGPIAHCNKCGMDIQSMYRHNFVWCECQSVAIDGGADYTKMTGSSEDWEILADRQIWATVNEPSVKKDREVEE